MESIHTHLRNDGYELTYQTDSRARYKQHDSIVVVYHACNKPEEITSLSYTLTSKGHLATFKTNSHKDAIKFHEVGLQEQIMNHVCSAYPHEPERN